MCAGDKTALTKSDCDISKNGAKVVVERPSAVLDRFALLFFKVAKIGPAKLFGDASKCWASSSFSSGSFASYCASELINALVSGPRYPVAGSLLAFRNLISVLKVPLPKITTYHMIEPNRSRVELAAMRGGRAEPMAGGIAVHSY
jgi:hypothetical protein